MISYALKAKSLTVCCTPLLVSLFILCSTCTTPVCAQFCDMEVPGELFCDDFTNPNPTDPGREPVQWRPLVGQMSLSEDSLEISGSGDLSRAQPVGVYLKDLSIRTQVTTYELTSPFVQLRFNPGAGDTGYFAGLAGETAYISVSGNNIRDLGTAETDFYTPSEDVLMQFDAFGEELSLYVWRPGEPFPDSPTVSVTDDTITGPGIVTFGAAPSSFPGPDTHWAKYRFAQAATTPIPEPSSIVLSYIGFLPSVP